MRAFGTETRALILGSALLFGCPLVVDSARAAQYERHGPSEVKPTASLHAHPLSRQVTLARGMHVSSAMYFAGRHNAAHLQCVPYARHVSGIQVTGNAWQWWDNAAGVYARGEQPEVGSVLNFRANGRMRLGHVAVVTEVINPREVIVDHANWPSGGIGGGRISRGVAVVDVSEANNWSAVRVELGHESAFGSVYPTYGFIYNRPDTGVMVASVSRPAPQPEISPPRSDLRPAAERPWQTLEEVAEWPTQPRRIDLSVPAAAIRAAH